MVASCTKPRVDSNEPKYAFTYATSLLYDGDKNCGVAKNYTVFQNMHRRRSRGWALGRAPIPGAEFHPSEYTI